MTAGQHSITVIKLQISFNLSDKFDNRNYAVNSMHKNTEMVIRQSRRLNGGLTDHFPYSPSLTKNKQCIMYSQKNEK